MEGGSKWGSKWGSKRLPRYDGWPQLDQPVKNDI